MRTFRLHSRTKARLLAGSLFVTSLISFHAASAAVSPAISETLPSGAVLVTRSDKIAPRIAISLLIRAGAADETVATGGWRQVLVGAMLRATKLPDGKVRTLGQWQQLSETWGGEIGATTGEDFIEFYARGDSAYTLAMTEALLQIAETPRLSDEDIGWARRRALEIVGQGDGGVARRAAQGITSALYKDAQGGLLAYALPDYGTFESLSNLSNEQVRQEHVSFFKPSRMIVSAAGNVTPSGLHDVLLKNGTPEAGVAATAATADTDTSPQFAPLPSKVVNTVRDMETTGAWVLIGYRTPAMQNVPAADFAALQVLAAALDGSGEARLTKRLINKKVAGNAREKADQVAAQWTPRRWAGEMVVLAQTDKANANVVQAALLDEVKKLRETPLTPTELVAAKTFARGQWAVGREMSRERAFQAALPQVWKTFPDTDWPQKISAVTAADIQRAAKQYLQAYAAVLIMPAS